MTNENPVWPDHFNVGHALAFIYLTFARHSDDELHKSEVQMIAVKLNEWEFVEDAAAVLKETGEFWGPLNKEQTLDMFAGAVAFMKDKMTPEGRRMVHEDLYSVAAADGKAAPGEAQWLALLERGLGLDG